MIPVIVVPVVKEFMIHDGSMCLLMMNMTTTIMVMMKILAKTTQIVLITNIVTNDIGAAADNTNPTTNTSIIKDYSVGSSESSNSYSDNEDENCSRYQSRNILSHQYSKHRNWTTSEDDSDYNQSTSSSSLASAK
jgi:hypothetical protein